MVERGHQVEMGGLLVLNGVNKKLRIPSWKSNKCSIDQSQGDQGAHPHGVVEGHHPDGDFVHAVLILSHMGQRGSPLGPLTSGHPFWLARGAGGVEHDRPIVGVTVHNRIGTVAHHL